MEKSFKPNKELMLLFSEPSRYHTSLLSFNFAPISYIHLDWVKKILSKDYSQAVHDEVLQSMIAGRKLNQFIIEKMQLKPLTNLAAPLKMGARIALLPSATLLELFENIGLLFYMDDIKKIITRADVQALQSLIGEERYLLFLKRMPFLFSSSFIKKVRRRRQPAFNLESLTLHSRELGYFYFGLLLLQEEKAVRTRARLKFPPGEAWDFASKVNSRYALSDIVLLFQKMIRETLPQWQDLFV